MTRQVVVAAALFGLCEVVVAATGIADNVLWAPDTPLRAVALLVTLTPLAALAVSLVRSAGGRRRRAERSRG